MYLEHFTQDIEGNQQQIKKSQDEIVGFGALNCKVKKFNAMTCLKS